MVENIYSINKLKEELLLNDKQIKILFQLPPDEQREYLIERKMRVDIMNALIASGTDKEEAKKVLTDTEGWFVVEEDELGNKRERPLYQ